MVLYVKTFPHLWQYLAEFFLETEMFQTKFMSIKFLSKYRAVYEIM